MRISDWSSDVCSSDLCRGFCRTGAGRAHGLACDRIGWPQGAFVGRGALAQYRVPVQIVARCFGHPDHGRALGWRSAAGASLAWLPDRRALATGSQARLARSEEHTSELQSLMRISYAVFCLKKKNNLDITTL